LTELAFDVVSWLAPSYGDDAARATAGSLRITAGAGLHVPVTEVEDTLAQTVRPYINVPVVAFAEWLVVNWWRVRWEGTRSRRSEDWRRAHNMASIGGGDAWPSLELSSDGQFVQLCIDAESAPDVAGVRYLRTAALDVPVADFEAAVDRLLDVVEARLASCAPTYRELTELRGELAEERANPELSRENRWQAQAGMDPGSAGPDWLESVRAVVDEVGGISGGEVIAAIPDLRGGLPTALRALAAMKQSPTSVDLSFLGDPTGPAEDEHPWETGVRLAQELRAQHGLSDAPLSNDILANLLKTSFPLPAPRSDTTLSGGFRNGRPDGRTSILWKGRAVSSQRFYLARLMGAARVLPASEHVVPVTDTHSALQKLERAFAQELLCPWRALDQLTDESGLGDDALAEAAAYFEVSEWVVRTALVNRGKAGRSLLPQPQQRG
jgi:hypothetical protein